MTWRTTLYPTYCFCGIVIFLWLRSTAPALAAFTLFCRLNLLRETLPGLEIQALWKISPDLALVLELWKCFPHWDYSHRFVKYLLYYRSYFIFILFQQYWNYHRFGKHLLWDFLHIFEQYLLLWNTTYFARTCFGIKFTALALTAQILRCRRIQ